MTPDASLERTVDTVLTQVQGSVIAKLDESHKSSQDELVKLRPRLEAEYDRIISEAKKEADKLERQITGSAELEARNTQLRIVQDATDKVFAKAASQIAKSQRDSSYAGILDALVAEAVDALGTSDVLVYTSDADAKAVESAISSIKGASLAPERIECMGGVKLQTRDGLTAFDNTLDAKLDRLKPLIRKEIASRFGLGE